MSPACPDAGKKTVTDEAVLSLLPFSARLADVPQHADPPGTVPGGCLKSGGARGAVSFAAGGGGRGPLPPAGIPPPRSSREPRRAVGACRPAGWGLAFPRGSTEGWGCGAQRYNPAHRACQQSEPRPGPPLSTAPGSPHLHPLESSRAAPGPWPSARCPHGQPAGHGTWLSTPHVLHRSPSPAAWIRRPARSPTRALLAVSHVGSTARRVMVPAVTTCGRMAP